jgi:two-component system NtrC family sensor kinase
MRQNLRVSLGAVVLALATLAAVIFALINFDQRSRFEVVYDGVAWLDTDHGIQANRVSPNSPATRAGIRPGDVLLTINKAPIARAAQVAQRLERAGLWTQVRYKLSRGGEEFETPLLTAPAEKPLATENYLRIVGLLYLFIGLFIFIRRWNAPRAVHFYVFCLVSFVLWSFHFSGKLDTFDWEVYWSEIVARLLAPALLLHFALVFPGRSESTIRSSSKLLAVYSLPVVLLLVHLNTALKENGFLPWLASYILLTKFEFGYLAACFLVAGLVFYRNYREAPSGVLRQQLKWLTGGTLAGSLPVSLLDLLP